MVLPVAVTVSTMAVPDLLIAYWPVIPSVSVYVPDAASLKEKVGRPTK
jgi:hypothetical protein